MSEVKMYAVGVSTDWCFMHMNKKTANAIGKGCVVFQDLQNNMQHFLYKTEDEQ